MPDFEDLRKDVARAVAFDHAQAHAKTHRLLQMALEKLSAQDAYLSHLTDRINQMAADVDARFATIVSDMQSQTSVVDSFDSFLGALQAEVSSMKAELAQGDLTDAQEQVLTDFDNALKANTAKLQAALTANTPGGAATPVATDPNASAPGTVDASGATAPSATAPADGVPTGPDGAAATVPPAGA